MSLPVVRIARAAAAGPKTCGLLSFFLAVLAASVLSCGSRDHRATLFDPSEVLLVAHAEGGVSACSTPAEGCACDADAGVVSCERTVQSGASDYVVCWPGTRTCNDGHWGPCVESSTTRGVSRYIVPVTSSAMRRQTLSLGTSSQSCNSSCDPSCVDVTDTADGLDAGSGFENVDAGLSLKRTVLIGCSSLTITPSSSTATVTQILPSVVAAPIQLTATLNPACLSSPFTVYWTVDRFDVTSITGTNNTDGVLNVLHPIAGDVVVTAYAAGLSATTTIHVKVNAVQSSSVSPNDAATATQIAKFTGSGTTTSQITWLYPYAGTYFPLGLLAPVVQYWHSSDSNGGATKVSLRYPENATAASSTFNYSIVVAEANVVSKNSPANRTANTKDVQVVLPQLAWQAFEQTARGNNASLVVQRLRSDGTTLENESFRSVRLVDGQLKGTVFYNSYSSQIGGANTGAVLAIKPGDSSPTLAVQPSGKCTVCHTLNAGGTRIIVAGGRSSNSIQFNQSRRYDLSTPSSWPSPTVLNSYDNSTGNDSTNIQGDKFNFGAPWTDGSLYMTHGGSSSYGGDANWRASPDYSRLYNPNSPATAISVTSWSNISAITPRFSADGTKLAFAYGGASGSTLPQSPSGTLAPDSTGKTLVVADFGCSTSTCTSSSTGWKVTNARNVTPSLTNRVGWPTFTPAGDAVIYQRQYVSSKYYLSWSPSDINTVAGALAELWISNVPSNKSGTVTPTELRALNGLNSSGASYLPTTPTTSSPSYHAANASFQITQADYCGTTATVSGVNDYQLNYLPYTAPADAGGYNWVVFTSRRMYGNIAYDDPWDAEPGPTACSGGACSCSSGSPPAKKLWIAAIDETFTPGTDPSHPAFYMPGQELMAGNSNGYWVSSACSALGATCVSSDDCCGGTGSSPTSRCAASTKTCQSVSSCAGVNQTCIASSDCCTGLVCGGSGKCDNPAFYGTQTYRREYVADCPSGKHVVWRYFEWQATIPTSTSISLAVQTKQTASEAYQPSTAVAMDPITASTASGVWGYGSRTVDTVLGSASPPVSSQNYLLVTLTFNPDSTATQTPTLLTWRQDYDCADAE